MAAYYNEIDPYAAEWLRNLIKAGLIADGVVDTRSIEDVHPIELRCFTQCHFFAGVGVWSCALRLAGWPDDRRVWTGSCPCQPFSAAGKGAGFDDERHLWPAWHHLIRECRPAAVLGEQVASADSGPWIDLVHDDLETLDYAFGAIPFPSAGVSAPHIRDRLYFVANADERAGRQRRAHAGGRTHGSNAQPRAGLGGCGVLDQLGHAQSERCREARGTGPGSAQRPADAGAVDRLGQPAGARPQGGEHPGKRSDAQRQAAERTGTAGGMDDARSVGRRARRDDDAGNVRVVADAAGGAYRPGPTNGIWRAADWLLCRDGKWRPVEPGTFPLAHGAPSRVGRLRAYGNAINAEAARVFIEAVLDTELA